MSGDCVWFNWWFEEISINSLHCNWAGQFWLKKSWKWRHFAIITPKRATVKLQMCGFFSICINWACRVSRFSKIGQINDMLTLVGVCLTHNRTTLSIWRYQDWEFAYFISFYCEARSERRFLGLKRLFFDENIQFLIFIWWNLVKSWVLGARRFFTKKT